MYRSEPEGSFSNDDPDEEFDDENLAEPAAKSPEDTVGITAFALDLVRQNFLPGYAAVRNNVPTAAEFLQRLGITFPDTAAADAKRLVEDVIVKTYSAMLVSSAERFVPTFATLCRLQFPQLGAPVAPGQLRKFHSTLAGPDAAGILVRQHSGSFVTVLGLAAVAEREEPSVGPYKHLWLVRASDDTEFQAWDVELDGKLEDTNDWFGPVENPEDYE